MTDGTVSDCECDSWMEGRKEGRMGGAECAAEWNRSSRYRTEQKPGKNGTNKMGFCLKRGLGICGTGIKNRGGVSYFYIFLCDFKMFESKHIVCLFL